MEPDRRDIFLLTKPPGNPRSELCFKLIARSEASRLYLAGDGVYHLLAGIEVLPSCGIYACKEDLEARAVRSGKEVTVPEDFYAVLVEDLMEHCDNEYTF